MKDLIAIFSTEKKSFELRELPPESLASSHHVKLRVKWVGICGSDLSSIETQFLKELSLGHEWIGEVTETGSAVTSVKKGDFVTSTVMINCGTCPECLSGSGECAKKYSLAVNHGMLRTTAQLPEAALVKVPSPADKNSTLFEILAVGENVFEKTRQHLKPGQPVLILGAGLLGLSVGLVLKKRGYDPLLLEVISSRIRRAQSLGLNSRHMTEALLDQTLKDSQEFIVDASGDHLGSKGGWPYLEHFGKKNFRTIMLAKYLQPISVRTDRYFQKQASIDWIQGCTRYSLEEAIRNWKDELPVLGPQLITHTFPLEQVNEAFDAAKNREQSARVIITL
ncbi:MAG: alcohol dehydrogenase catalytic domain-containing protein [Bdellovibrionota bacterium]